VATLPHVQEMRFYIPSYDGGFSDVLEYLKLPSLTTFCVDALRLWTHSAAHFLAKRLGIPRTAS
jgi:hypothetical protein